MGLRGLWAPQARFCGRPVNAQTPKKHCEHLSSLNFSLVGVYDYVTCYYFKLYALRCLQKHVGAQYQYRN